MSVSKRNGSKYFYIQFQYNGRTYIKSSKTPDKQLIKSGGGQSAAFHLLEHHDLQSFEKLCKTGFKDCTIESFIVSEKYRRYFTTTQLRTAQDRLDLF